MECLCPSVHPLVSPRRKVWITYIQAYMPHESSEDSSNQPDGPMGSHRCPPWPTEWRYQKFDRNRYRDFFPIPNFPKPIPRLFFRYQIFRNRNRYPQKIGKSFETEKFRNRNVNLWPWLMIGYLSCFPTWVCFLAPSPDQMLWGRNLRVLAQPWRRGWAEPKTKN